MSRETNYILLRYNSTLGERDKVRMNSVRTLVSLISVQCENDSLKNLSRTSSTVRDTLLELSKNSHWWFSRVEALSPSVSLQFSSEENWKRIYCKIEYAIIHNERKFVTKIESRTIDLISMRILIELDLVESPIARRLKGCAQGDNLRVFEYLMKDYKYTGTNSDLIVACCKHKSVNVLQYILNCPKFSITSIMHQLINACGIRECYPLVQIMISNERVCSRINDWDLSALEEAAINNNPEAIRLVLSHPKANKSQEVIEPVLELVLRNTDDNDLIEELISLPNIVITPDILCAAIVFDGENVVPRLLQCELSNRDQCHSTLLIEAAEMSNATIVSYVLQLPDVVLSSEDIFEALKLTLLEDNEDIGDMLIRDKRLNLDDIFNDNTSRVSEVLCDMKNVSQEELRQELERIRASISKEDESDESSYEESD